MNASIYEPLDFILQNHLYMQTEEVYYKARPTKSNRLLQCSIIKVNVIGFNLV
jgi:hypothetical protein